MRSRFIVPALATALALAACSTSSDAEASDDGAADSTSTTDTVAAADTPSAEDSTAAEDTVAADDTAAVEDTADPTPQEHVMGRIDHVVTDLSGQAVDLSQYRGRVMLVVNVASACGFTPQYAGLQQLWETYGDQGLSVLGFPCNQFGGQEPGSTDEIATFCSNEYGVTFDMFDKVDVNGGDRSPLYTTLTTESPEAFQGDIQWNFTKFLVDRDGYVIARFESAIDPQSQPVIEAIEAALAE